MHPLLSPPVARRPVRLLAAHFALALAITGGCGKPKPVAIPPPTVQVLVASATNVTTQFEAIGRLDSPQNVEIRARIEAFVHKIHFADGAQVKEGDLLFTLDRRPFEEKVAAAEGALAEAKASLNKSERDVNRLRPLAKVRAIPQQDLENAQAAVEVAQAAVASAEARVASARLDLSYCELKAPTAGLIGASQVTVGSLVGRGQPTLMATLSQLDPIWFHCFISEVDYLKAERGTQEKGRKVSDTQPSLVLADGSELSEPGRWIFLDRAVDAVTGTIRARAEFSNHDKTLRPGMFGRARVSIKSDKPRVVIPQRAVLELQGRSFVWVLRSQESAAAPVAEQRHVQISARFGSSYAIESGLEPGETYIVEGLNKVRQGSPVTVLTAEQVAAAANTATTGAAK